jgi:hypothetical protein
LHIGSARTFIFNWLYARHYGGTVILRIDDTDVERNTDASLASIFDGLRWLDLPWDEEYKQSERLGLHRAMAEAIFQKGLAYRDFVPAQAGESDKPGAAGTWLFHSEMREMSREESPSPSAFASLATPNGISASPTPSMASSPKPRPTWRISRCCAATACRPTTWHPAPTTPICASAISSAARTTSPTPSSTC